MESKILSDNPRFLSFQTEESFLGRFTNPENEEILEIYSEHLESLYSFLLSSKKSTFEDLRNEVLMKLLDKGLPDHECSDLFEAICPFFLFRDNNFIYSPESDNYFFFEKETGTVYTRINGPKEALVEFKKEEVATDSTNNKIDRTAKFKTLINKLKDWTTKVLYVFLSCIIIALLFYICNENWVSCNSRNPVNNQDEDNQHVNSINQKLIEIDYVNRLTDEGQLIVLHPDSVDVYYFVSTTQDFSIDKAKSLISDVPAIETVDFLLESGKVLPGDTLRPKQNCTLFLYCRSNSSDKIENLYSFEFNFPAFIMGLLKSNSDSYILDQLFLNDVVHPIEIEYGNTFDYYNHFNRDVFKCNLDEGYIITSVETYKDEIIALDQNSNVNSIKSRNYPALKNVQCIQE